MKLYKRGLGTIALVVAFVSLVGMMSMLITMAHPGGDMGAFLNIVGGHLGTLPCGLALLWGLSTFLACVQSDRKLYVALPGGLSIALGVLIHLITMSSLGTSLAELFPSLFFIIPLLFVLLGVLLLVIYYDGKGFPVEESVPTDVDQDPEGEEERVDHSTPPPR